MQSEMKDFCLSLYYSSRTSLYLAIDVLRTTMTTRFVGVVSSDVVALAGRMFLMTSRRSASTNQNAPYQRSTWYTYICTVHTVRARYCMVVPRYRYESIKNQGFVGLFSRERKELKSCLRSLSRRGDVRWSGLLVGRNENGFFFDRLLVDHVDESSISICANGA